MSERPQCPWVVWDILPGAEVCQKSGAIRREEKNAQCRRCEKGLTPERVRVGPR